MDIHDDYEHIARTLASRNTRSINNISRDTLIAYANDIHRSYDHIGKILDSGNERAINAISRDNLIAYANDIFNDYEHIARILNSRNARAINVISWVILNIYANDIRYGYDHIGKILDSRNEHAINTISRDILIVYANDIYRSYDHIGKILDSCNERAINAISRDNLIVYANDIFNDYEHIARILNSRNARAINAISWVILNVYANDIGCDYECIGRIVDSGSERAVNAISRDILITYANDISHDYDHIERILASRNERAMSAIYRDTLITYANDISHDYDHIERILASRNERAMNAIPRDTLIAYVDDAMHGNRGIQKIIASGSYRALQCINPGNLKSYVLRNDRNIKKILAATPKDAEPLLSHDVISAYQERVAKRPRLEQEELQGFRAGAGPSGELASSYERAIVYAQALVDEFNSVPLEERVKTVLTRPNNYSKRKVLDNILNKDLSGYIHDDNEVAMSDVPLINLGVYLNDIRNGYDRIECILSSRNARAMNVIMPITLSVYANDIRNGYDHIERILNSRNKRAMNAISPGTLSVYANDIRNGYGHIEIILSSRNERAMNALSQGTLNVYANDISHHYDHIERILDSRNKRAMKAIPRDILIVYANDISHHYDHIERILDSRNKRAMNAIPRDILIVYANDISHDYDHIDRILNSRNARAMNAIPMDILIVYANDISRDYDHIERILDSRNARAINSILPISLSAYHERIVATVRRRIEQKLGGSSGLSKLEECLPDSSTGGSEHDRSKRNVVGEICELSWEEVDEFNQEKEKPRKFSKIKINSDKFLAFLENPFFSEAKRVQLLQLAGGVSIITGTMKDSVFGLVKHQKTLAYLHKVGRVSGMAMYGVMGKNTLRDLLREDYKGVAINVGFIAGGQGFAKVAEAVTMKGSELVLSGQPIVLGQSLRLASPFLARGTSAFVAYDLINQIKAYQQENPDALVGIVGDSLFLGIDGVEIGIETGEIVGLLEGVSSFTGPIGAAIGGIVFVGMEVYAAVKQVNKEDALIHLSSTEKFIEGLRAFVGMRPEQYLETLLEEKQGNNQLFARGLAFLKNQTEIQRYIMPTVKSVEECRTIKRKSICSPLSLGPGGVLVVCTPERKVKECTGSKLEANVDNTILLDAKRIDIKWGRVKPDATEGSLFCGPKGSEMETSRDETYLCDKAMGIDYPNFRTGNATLIELGDGNDTVVGFPYGDHVVMVGNGHKNIGLAEGNDTFLLDGYAISGILFGGRGINTLDLDSFAKQQKSIHIELLVEKKEQSFFAELGVVGYAVYSAGSKSVNRDERLEVYGINNFLLRANKQDIVSTGCHTRYIDARGGDKHDEGYDLISILENDHCHYAMKLMLRPYMGIFNANKNGGSEFSYVLPASIENEGLFYVDLQGNGLHCFMIDYPVSHINGLKQVDDVIIFGFVKNIDDIILNNSSRENEFELWINQSYRHNLNNIRYKFRDNTEIKVVGNDFYVFQSTNRSVDNLIKDYSHLATRLNMTMVVQSQLMNESIAIGHGKHDVLRNDPYRRSHLIGNGGENIFVIGSGYKLLDKDKLPLPEVILYDVDDENLIDTLDLREIRTQLEKDLGLKIQARIGFMSQHVIIELFSPEDVVKNLVTVRLNDTLVTNWHKRLHIILHHAPMKLDVLDLKPLPLEFSPDKDIVIISAEDIEENATLVIPKKSGDYDFFRSEDNLLISNARDSDLAEKELVTLILEGYYQTPKLASLSLRFANKKIVLKDESTSIANATDFSEELGRYRSKMYDMLFNKNVAQEDIRRIARSYYKDSRQSVEESVVHSIEKKETNRSIWGVVLPIIAGAGTLLGAGMGLRYHMRNRLRANALSIVAALPLLPPTAEATSINQEVALAKETLDKDRVVEMDGCVLGARNGDEFVTGITCYTKNNSVMIFPKDSDVKLEKPEAKFFKESCRPIEFNGRPSVYCEGEKTNIVYTPEVFELPLERINDQLRLLQVGLHMGKKLYHWLQSSSSEKNSEVPSQKVSITTEQKTIWIELLVDIETRLAHLNNTGKVKDELDWARHILEDRRKEYKSLIQTPQVSLEAVTALTEDLKALQSELEVILNPVSVSNSNDKQSSVRDAQKENVANDSSPWTINTALLSNSAKQRIGFKPSISQGFFKQIPQTSTSLPLHAMNSSMSLNTTQDVA